METIVFVYFIIAEHICLLLYLNVDMDSIQKAEYECEAVRERFFVAMAL